MAVGISQDEKLDRAHSDINVLAQRVSGIENSITGITASIENLARKLDTRPTNWIGVMTGGAAMLTVVGGFLIQGKAPLDDQLARHDREIGHITDTAVTKEDFAAYRLLQHERNDRVDLEARQDEGDVTALRVKVAEMDGRSTERFAAQQDAQKRLEARVDSVDGAQIKRAELESKFSAIESRVDALQLQQNAPAMVIRPARHDAN